VLVGFLNLRVFLFYYRSQRYLLKAVNLALKSFNASVVMIS
jgi:hypothetical protein